MAVANNNKLDWLPQGWKVEDKVKNGRKVRCYINVKSSKRLYSKTSVLSHIRKTRLNNQRSRSQLSNGPLTRSSRNMELPLSREPNKFFDSLPPGWITEVKTRKSGGTAGVKYKIYIETSTGNTFYSKPEVSRYLRGKEQSTGSFDRKKIGATGDSLINGSVHTLRHHNPDREQEVPQHPKSVDEKSQPLKMRKEVPQHPKSDDEKSQPLKMRKEVPQYPNSDNEKSQPLKMRKEVPRHPSSDDEKSQPLQMRKEVPQHPKSDDEKSQPLKMRKEVPQHPKSDDEKSQPLKMRKVIVETVIDEGLPPGWIKEIRIKKYSNGARRDILYNDTTTGYVFRSRSEVRRYLETGEISKHAYKRKDGCRNIMQSMQETPSAATVRSNNTEGKESLEGSSLPNRRNSKVGDTGSDTVLAGSNALLDIGADVDFIPIEAQTPEPKENNVVRMASEPNISERKLKRNRKEMVSSRRSSKRLAGIEIEHVTHSLAIEKVLRLAKKKSAKIEIMPSSGSEEAEQCQQAPQVINVGSHELKSDTIPLKNEFVGAEQSKDKEECVKTSSLRKPERNRKLRRSSKLLAGIEAVPVTQSIATPRVLRSASSKSSKIEPVQGEQAKEAPLVINAGVQEETVCQYTESATVPVKNVVGQYTESATVPVKNVVGQYIESATVPVKNGLLEAERIKDKEEYGKRSRSRERKPRSRKEKVLPHRASELLAGVEVEPVTHSKPTQRVLRSATAKTEAMRSLGSEQGGQKEAPLVINSQEIDAAASILPEDKASKATDKTVMIDFSWNTTGGQTTIEPSRNNAEDQRLKKPPKNNSKEPFTADELTTVLESNGRQKEVQDSHFSFPWSDPCIEFAYKTLTGALPLDDTLAIHDYVQHQIRTSSNTIPDSRPSTFSLNTIPSNSSNSITFPDPGPPGFSRGGNHPKLPDARPPGFPRNAIPSNSGNFPDAKPPGFSRNIVPSNSGNIFPIPDARPPGFPRNIAPSNSGNSHSVSDARPPGFLRNTSVPSNSGINHSIPDARPPGFSVNVVSSNGCNNLQDSGPPGFSRGSVSPNRGNNLPIPDGTPPGFSRSSVTPNRGNNLPIPDGKPPGFSRSSIPSNSSNNFTLPGARPPGFSWTAVPSNNGNNPALPDTKPPGFPWSSVPSNNGNGNNPALPVTKPPGFPWSSVPSNNGSNNPALPDAKPPGFPWSSVPANSGNNPSLPDTNPSGFPWSSSTPPNSSDNPSLPDTNPSGFPWSRVPPNSGNNPALPEAKPSGFSWSSVLSNSSIGIGINLNVALPDTAPPGFSQKIVPSSKQQQQHQQQQQQQINPAGACSQSADFPLQGTMFSTWNHHN